MKRLVGNILLLLAVGLSGGCNTPETAAIPITPVISPTTSPSITPVASPTTSPPVTPVVSPTTSTPEYRRVFSEAEMKTLASLQQVDDYPLYVMKYFWEDGSVQTSSRPAAREPGTTPNWACSLFTVLPDADHMLYGRNFDWRFSPALLVFMDPADGYASVSMTDTTYLGYSDESAARLMDLPFEERGGLLEARLYPFDGMNEHGLVIGMATVPSGNMQSDPTRPHIGSIEIIREILDHARDVEEAIDLFRKYDIQFIGGPPLHYLIADAKGRAVLVEFYQGEMHLFNNTQPWLSATNFLRAAVEDPMGNCWRYDRINIRLNEEQGWLDPDSAMELLAEVAQDNTQWSVVYQMKGGEVSVAMGKDYADVHTFRISDYLEPK